MIIENSTEKQLQERLLKWQESLEKYKLKMNVMLCSNKEDEQVSIKDAHDEELKHVKVLRT